MSGGAHGMTYSEYLRLDLLLDAQAPQSPHHDEMLFIVIHQASELWMKLCLIELEAARDALHADRLRPSFKYLARVARIQAQLIQSWDVLGTMTPSDYSAFRPYLGTSSGFQSHQYRLLEFILGNKNAAMVDVHKDAPDLHGLLAQALTRPSLYDEALRLLSRRGFAIPQAVLARDVTLPHAPSPAVEAAWRAIYSDVEGNWDVYELAEKLVDLEMRLQQWRFAHLKSVERIIGHKMGTGGTSGAAYLDGVLKGSFFPELLTVRTAL